MRLTHKGTVELATPRLTLRRLSVDDAQEMYQNWACDPQVTRFLTWEPYQSVSTACEYLEAMVKDYARSDFYNWGIVFEGALVGSISVVRVDEEDFGCWIGYCIGRAWWGRGIVAEALRAVIGFLFSAVGFERVAAIHDRENPNSGKVMRKAGMTYEGTLRKSKFGKGRFIDTVYYAILREEWEERP